MKFTAFCIDLTTNAATTWICGIEADTEDTAISKAEEACAADWECSTDDILCVGLADGDVSIAYWHPDH